MNIAGVAFACPERVVTNDDVLDIVASASRDVYEGDLPQALRTIRFYLNYMGADQRRWLDKGEQAFTYTARAINEALDQAGLDKNEIDLLIHASVDKRVMEPGMAFFIAKAMGMDNTQCFDVTEACASWTRATQIAQSFLATGEFRNILIVTAEYTAHEDELLWKNYQVRTLADVEWAFASYTIGEGSTATVLTRDDGKPWTYSNRTDTRWADLCVLPIFGDNPGTMYFDDVPLAGRGPLRFVSYSRKMQDNALSALEDMVLASPVAADQVDLFIPHTNTLATWRASAKKLDLQIPYIFLLPQYGNLVTSSIPAALAVARAQARLTRNDRVAVMMTAAGMSYTIYNFVY